MNDTNIISTQHYCVQALIIPPCLVTKVKDNTPGYVTVSCCFANVEYRTTILQTNATDNNHNITGRLHRRRKMLNFSARSVSGNLSNTLTLTILRIVIILQTTIISLTLTNNDTYHLMILMLVITMIE
jgi:hypothetical protein